LTTVLSTVALFTSCSKDGEDDQASIVGTWLGISYEEEEYIDDELRGSYTDILSEEEVSTVTFNSDGTFETSYEYESEISSESGTYAIEGNILSITYDVEDSEIEQHSITLTDNQLVLVYTEDYTLNDETITYIGTATYSRQ
ncbi:MAG: lipocalin family protein, partial [Flavobacteriaceae bacterium]